MRKPSSASSPSQATESGQPPSGSQSQAQTTAATMAAAAGDGEADEVLAVGAAGILGHGIHLHVETGQAAGAAEQEEEGDEVAGVEDLAAEFLADGGVDQRRPRQGEHGGGEPKLMTSASESISRPKSLVVLVMRAMRPSSPSSSTAAPMAWAATVKCSGAPGVTAGSQQRALGRSAGWPDIAQEDIAGVKSVGST